MLRTITIGTISAQGEVVSRSGDLATVDAGGRRVTGYLLERTREARPAGRGAASRETVAAWHLPGSRRT